MAVPRITLYFDICSPFSYIAFHILTNSPVFSTCEIDFVPVSLRGLFQKSQNSSPMSSKSKAWILFTLSRIKFRGFGARDLTKVADKFQWINKERLYWARRFDVPMSEAIPEGFPASTADIQLVLSVLAKEAPEKVVAMTQTIYREYWGKCNPKVLSPDGFSVLLEQELGSELAEHVLAQSKTDEAKSALDETTEKLFGSGAFGLPWLSCTRPQGETEGFWGIDHFGRVVDFLHLNRALDSSFEVLL
ncbi:uncharacterized protein N7506_007557 [Penicillium brevicompactum]|uniref:uncharacterized protein n=1 Tax=Penicillium brevicompactum TaxID=5074 RepID=UPI00253FBB9F|nr:uncharacterized protein N7506_007557 [Penicillium brevicompactum]KAJ5333774.1 hypothetical protein N7506_007557 [Penicillium brevicompactum]